MNKTLNIFSKVILLITICLFVSVLFFYKKNDNLVKSQDLEVTLDLESGIYNFNFF